MKTAVKAILGLTAIFALGACRYAAGEPGAVSIPVAATTETKQSASGVPASQLQAAMDEPVGKVVKTDAEWKKVLTSQQYEILRHADTAPAFVGSYEKTGDGIYRCAACGLPLFSSDTQFDSGTGWPSFWKPINKTHVIEKTDGDGERTEVLCARCGGHLGHVFNDGPKPTGLRYCMNAPVLKFEPVKLETTTQAAPQKVTLQKATFAAGCFWSMEAIFKQLKGVQKVEPGYAGGTKKNPTYEEVETGTTGYAETADISFDPKVISYRDLLEILLTVRNPTTPNKQGPDEGPQYRSVIFYRDTNQKAEAEATIQKFTQDKVWKAPIVTEVKPFAAFWRAEDYHLDYYNKHPDQPYCAEVIAPEIKEFREKFKDKLKS